MANQAAPVPAATASNKPAAAVAAVVVPEQEGVIAVRPLVNAVPVVSQQQLAALNTNAALMGMMGLLARSIYHGDYISRSEADRRVAEAEDRRNEALRREDHVNLPIADMATACKLCSAAMVVNLVNFQPEKAEIRYCKRQCQKPTVAHVSCMIKYMEDNGLGKCSMGCPTCNQYIELTRELAVKPSNLPVTILRLFFWLISTLVLWPLLFYPLLFFLSWFSDFMDWYADPKHHRFPGRSLWYTPHMGPWLLIDFEEKWLGAIFFSIVLFSSYRILKWAFEWPPLSWVAKLWRVGRRGMYTYK